MRGKSFSISIIRSSKDILLSKLEILQSVNVELSSINNISYTCKLII